MRKSKFIQVIASLVFIFLLIPLIIIVVTSFGTAATVQFPIQGFTLDWYLVVFQSDTFKQSFVTSLIVGLIAVVLALLIGIPAAYALEKGQLKSKNFLNGIFLSPTLVPGMVIGYVLMQLVTVQFQLSIMTGLILSHLIISVPYVIRVVGSALQNMDSSLEEAAWTLGLTRTQAVYQIVLPNIRSGIISAFLLSFINSFNNIPVSMFLSGPGVSTLPITLMNYMEFNYDPSVSALSTLLMVVTIVLMILVDKTIGISAIKQTNDKGGQ